jgi:gamma-glutamyltranspeptidase/glutathione hydrolase
MAKSMRIGSTALVLGSLMITSTAVLADTKKRADTPEAGSGYKAKAAKTLKTRGVSSANPLASEAGHAILKAGGSAVDAAIAVQMVLNLVEPQSSGIGGGAFMLHHDGQKLQMFDGREAAPHLSHEELFVYNHGELMAFEEAMVGGRAVGVPGTLRMLEQAHRQHGQLPWAQLFQPAIKLSENGFRISPRLHAMLLADRPLRKDLNASAFFYRPNGQPLPVGHVLKNPGLAQVLKLIAKDGADAFHQGPLAQTIINKVQQHSYNPGVMTMRDMTNYRPIQREALCFSHAASTGPVQICGAGAPSSGLIATGQILGILSNTPASKDAPSAWADRNTVVPSLNWLHHYNEAARLAFADRALYVADPDFTKAPGGDWNKMLAPAYLQQRASLVQNQRMGNATAGQPGGAPMVLAPMADQTEYGTSHISIVDGMGNSVSMTTSIESAFGSRVMVNMGQRGGFLLNNQLTDFSFSPTDETGQLVANRVQANKRPRSSMNPLMVFEQSTNGERGQVMASLGSPGGPMIIHYTAQSLWAMLHWNQNAQQAVNMPHSGVTGANGPLLLEQGGFSADILKGLQDKNHVLLEVDMPSGLGALQRQGTQWVGGADPRREGQVSGD